VAERSYLNNSVDRALRVLEVFTEEQPLWSAAEVAAFLNTRYATLYPTLATLEAHGYLQRDELKRYRLGLKLVERSGQVLAGIDLRQVVRGHLRELAQQIGGNAHLAILYGNEVLYLLREVGQQAVVLSDIVGRRVPCHCTALGKALLASLPEEELGERVSALDFAPQTENTITDPERLLQEIAKVRRDGYALEIEEFHLGSSCVGVVVRNHEAKAVAAISVSMSASRLRDAGSEELIEAIRATADNIARELGNHAASSDSA